VHGNNRSVTEEDRDAYLLALTTVPAANAPLSNQTNCIVAHARRAGRFFGARYKF
jgi:hypothetical protein